MGSRGGQWVEGIGVNGFFSRPKIPSNPQASKSLHPGWVGFTATGAARVALHKIPHKAPGS